MIDQDPMQYGAADPIRNGPRKNRLGFLAAAHKANAAERMDVAHGNFDAQLAQGIESSGIKPSPHGLSIGGIAPSATVTLSPRRRAAIAVARPAGRRR